MFDGLAFDSVKDKHDQVCTGNNSKQSDSTPEPKYCHLCDYSTEIKTLKKNVSSYKEKSYIGGISFRGVT